MGGTNIGPLPCFIPVRTGGTLSLLRRSALRTPQAARMKAERVDTESSATEGSTSSSSYKTNSGPTLREAQLNARQRRLNAFEQRNSENRVPLPAEVPKIRKRGPRSQDLLCRRRREAAEAELVRKAGQRVLDFNSPPKPSTPPLASTPRALLDYKGYYKQLGLSQPTARYVDLPWMRSYREASNLDIAS